MCGYLAAIFEHGFSELLGILDVDSSMICRGKSQKVTISLNADLLTVLDSFVNMLVFPTSFGLDRITDADTYDHDEAEQDLSYQSDSQVLLFQRDVNILAYSTSDPFEKLMCCKYTAFEGQLYVLRYLRNGKPAFVELSVTGSIEAIVEVGSYGIQLEVWLACGRTACIESLCFAVEVPTFS